MGEVIAVVSGKGGVGKTITTANLAAALAMLGYKVIAVDGDIGLRNLDIVMGLEDKVLYNMLDVIQLNCKLEQAFIKDKRYNSLYLLPTAQFHDDDTVITKDEIGRIYAELREQFDYVLIDTPSGLNEIFKKTIYGIDKILVVVTQDNSSIRDADMVIRECDLPTRNCKIIFNRYKIEVKDFNPIYIAEDLCVDYIGVIPEDISINARSNRGEMLNENSLNYIDQEYINIAKRITGEEIPVTIPMPEIKINYQERQQEDTKVQKENKTFWAKLKDAFSK